jgi:hypothetical protein
MPTGIPAPCGYCACGAGEAAAGQWRPEQLAHLYVCCELSTCWIAVVTGLDRQRVTRTLHRAGVMLRARGAGRPRPLRRTGDPPGLAQLMAELYDVAGLSSREIAAVTGLPERTVRDRLHRYGIRARSRGKWNRGDRRTVPVQTLRDLYEQLGMTAAEVGKLIGVSPSTVLRSADSLGLSVRTGGAVPLAGPGEIELLTGQPAMTVRGFMRREGIPVRPPGGRTPFLRRWRRRQ